MKFFHLSDLHLGKRLNEYSLLEDQSYILDQILRAVDCEKPDGVIIAGDLYDKPTPPAEAVALLDSFLSRLAAQEIAVFIISGNHDSPERISFGARLMERSRVYLSPVYSGSISPITMEDTLGQVDVFLLPFIKPANVRSFYPDEAIDSYTAALSHVIAQLDIHPDRRNILVTHQFVMGAVRSESEDVTVGGSDAVDASVFAPFDYVALGHLHAPQNVSGDRIRYCGTPLKYSFSEAKQQKSITVVELGSKGELTIRCLPLAPLRDMIEIKGAYEELVERSYYQELHRDDYFHITLTNETDVPDAAAKLRVIYPNLMKLDYDNRRTRAMHGADDSAGPAESRSPLALFSDFYERQNGQPMTKEQETYMKQLIARLQEGNP